MRISDWSSDVCSSDLQPLEHQGLDDARGRRIGHGAGFADLHDRHRSIEVDRLQYLVAAALRSVFIPLSFSFHSPYVFHLFLLIFFALVLTPFSISLLVFLLLLFHFSFFFSFFFFFFFFFFF